MYLYLFKGIPEKSSSSMIPNDGLSGYLYRCFISLHRDRIWSLIDNIHIFYTVVVWFILKVWLTFKKELKASWQSDTLINADLFMGFIKKYLKRFEVFIQFRFRTYSVDYPRRRLRWDIT